MDASTNTPDDNDRKRMYSQNYYNKLVNDPDRLARRRETQREYARKKKEEKQKLIDEGVIAKTRKPRTASPAKENLSFEEKIARYASRLKRAEEKKNAPGTVGRPRKYVF